MWSRGREYSWLVLHLWALTPSADLRSGSGAILLLETLRWLPLIGTTRHPPFMPHEAVRVGCSQEPLLISCATLGRSFNLSVPGFSHL